MVTSNPNAKPESDSDGAFWLGGRCRIGAVMLAMNGYMTGQTIR